MALIAVCFAILYFTPNEEEKQMANEIMEEVKREVSPYTVVSSVAGPYNDAGIRLVLKSIEVQPDLLTNLEALKKKLISKEQVNSEYQMFYVFKDNALEFPEATVKTTDELIKYQREGGSKAAAVIHVPVSGDGFIEE